MKKYVGMCALFGGSEICVFADTVEEARKIALEDFIARVEKEMAICEVKARTDRCDICQYTFVPSEIIDTDGERLCWYCYDDKYGFGALTPMIFRSSFSALRVGVTPYTGAGKLDLSDSGYNFACLHAD